MITLIIIILFLVIICHFMWYSTTNKLNPEELPIELSFKSGNPKITLITFFVTLQVILMIVDTILLVIVLYQDNLA